MARMETFSLSVQNGHFSQRSWALTPKTLN